MLFRFKCHSLFLKKNLAFVAVSIMEGKQKNEVNKQSTNQSAKQCMQSVQMNAPVSFRIAWNA